MPATMAQSTVAYFDGAQGELVILELPRPLKKGTGGNIMERFEALIQIRNSKASRTSFGYTHH
jgi:hypothetical protein